MVESLDVTSVEEALDHAEKVEYGESSKESSRADNPISTRSHDAVARSSGGRMRRVFLFAVPICLLCAAVIIGMANSQLGETENVNESLQTRLSGRKKEEDKKKVAELLKILKDQELAGFSDLSEEGLKEHPFRPEEVDKIEKIMEGLSESRQNKILEAVEEAKKQEEQQTKEEQTKENVLDVGDRKIMLREDGTQLVLKAKKHWWLDTKNWNFKFNTTYKWVPSKFNKKKEADKKKKA